MVLVTSVRDYINRMLQDISGMKVLILDSETVSNVSIVYSQSELLQKEVFLVEMIDSISVSKESMSHLKAVYFIRPTSDNIQKLRYQLANPRFGEYHLFFSNLLKDTQIHILADSDEQEVVQQVQEYYADFVSGDPYHFTLNMASNHLYMIPAVVDPSGLQRFSDRQEKKEKMNFISDQVKKLSSSTPEEPDHNKPVEGTETATRPATNAELMASAKVVAEAAQAAARNESDKLDKGKVAGASADILDAAEKYGKFDEKSSTGQYLDKAEKYLNDYESSHSTGAGGPPPPTSQAEPASQPEPAAKKDDEESGGGLGGYAKMAQGFLK